MVAKLKFNKEKCKGCELCVSVCPKKILKIDDKNINKMGYHVITVTDMDACTSCANCALMCPDGVISVYRKKK
ncbi:MAG: 4Fe-4S binding protein [Clostridiales bacterium]|jgi:2-oxoglutarate ferredoxin oxidoreductase subunit delta|nr:4Fe-4S binding protein [Clostridiales bacterium]